MRSLKNLKWVILFIFLLLIFLCAVKFYPATNYTYQIRVDLKKLQLTLKECDTGREIYCFPIAGPASINYLKPLPKIGEVSKVTFHPYWYPTENIKKRYLNTHGVALPDVVPPNHPLNALGTVAISFVVDGKEQIVKIHGTNDPKSIGHYVSSGCIRMHNEDVEQLAKTICNARTQVIIFYDELKTN